MKRIVCEMCGCKDFVKDNGFFVCESCGTKYTLEEAKKMMIEGTVEVKGTVSIDSSKAEKDLLDVIETAIRANNYDNVYSSASKLVETNPSIWKGWFYKGIGAGYISKLGDNRYQELIVCFDKAYEVASVDERPEVKEKIVNETFVLSNLLIDFFSNSLVELPNETNTLRLTNALTFCLLEINMLSIKYGTSYVLIHDFEDKKTFKVWNDLKTIKSNADSELGRGRENRTDWKFESWLVKCDQVIPVLIHLLTGCPIRPNNVELYLNFLQKTIRDTTHTCSYQYSASAGKYVESKKLTRSAVKSRNQLWEETNAKKNELIKKAQEREKKYQQTRFDEYWTAHAEEKEKLLNEQSELTKKRNPYTERIEIVDKEISAVKNKYSELTSDELKEKELVKEIETISIEIKKFKLFDFKGKKPFKEKLKKTKGELKTVHKNALNSRQIANNEMSKELNKLQLKKDGILEECSELDKKLNFIKTELTKAR